MPSEAVRKTASQVTRMKLGSRMVKFFSFSQDRDSVLNTEDGRKKLRDVGIGTPSEVGDWRTSLINRTHSYIHRVHWTLLSHTQDHVALVDFLSHSSLAKDCSLIGTGIKDVISNNYQIIHTQFHGRL